MQNMSAEINELVTALAKAQGAFPEIGKDKNAKIQTKSGGSYAYDYADLATILAALRKPLAANGLAVLQPVTVNGHALVTTILAHTSGQWISSELPMPVSDAHDPRAVASAITYARRYGLLALLGVAPADEDDDADAAHAGRSKAREDASTKQLTTAESGTTVDTDSGVELAPCPEGYHYLTGYTIHGEWHEADILHWFDDGAALHVSTKLPKNHALVQKASNERIPAKCTVTLKRGETRKAYLNTIELVKAAPTQGELDAEIAKRDLARQASEVA